jgi:hypothetical protein
MYRFYAEKARECSGEEEITLFNMNTAVVFTLSLGRGDPAPSEK